VTTYRDRIATIARNRAVSAMNSAIIWIDHPSYNNKTAVLADLAAADAVLLTVADADGCMGAQYVAGINRYAMDDMRSEIVVRKGSTRIDLRPLFTAALVGPATMVGTYDLPS
jgi:hypothetical protein